MAESYTHRLSVAPMMQVTDRHWRYFARGLTSETLLYTEMVVDTALIHSAKRLKHLESDPCEAPVALQLGGNDPELLGQATHLATRHMDCSQVNLNCGCPSRAVATKHCFGASLMADPPLVGACVAAMQSQTTLPVTVKHRLGTDLSGAAYEDTAEFVRVVSGFGVRHFAVHARMAILGRRLSTEQNRSVPPLKPDVAHRLVKDFPNLSFSLNGGLKSLDDCLEHLRGDDAVHSTMLGRAAWHSPCDVLADADRRVFGKATNPGTTRRALIERYADYLDTFYVRQAEPDDIPFLFRPLHYVFAGARGARRFRVLLVDRAPSLLRHQDAQPSDIIWESLKDADVATDVIDAPLVCTN